MCRELWSSRSLLANLVCLRYSAEELQDKSYLQKVRVVYQCASENMHEDTSLARLYREHWRTATEQKRAKLPIVPQQWKFCVACLKARFVRGEYYSLSRDLYDRALSLQDGFDYDLAPDR